MSEEIDHKLDALKSSLPDPDDVMQTEYRILVELLDDHETLDEARASIEELIEQAQAMLRLLRKIDNVEPAKRELDHFLVTGHLEDGEDITKYVMAVDTEDAEQVFKKWLADQEDPDTRVLVSMVAQLRLPPFLLCDEYNADYAPVPLISQESNVES